MIGKLREPNAGKVWGMTLLAPATVTLEQEPRARLCKWDNYYKVFVPFGVLSLASGPYGGVRQNLSTPPHRPARELIQPRPVFCLVDVRQLHTGHCLQPPPVTATNNARHGSWEPSLLSRHVSAHVQRPLGNEHYPYTRSRHIHVNPAAPCCSAPERAATQAGGHQEY